MKPNVSLLQRTLAHIEDNPLQWRQLDWRCGTAGCFAHHAVVIGRGTLWQSKQNPDSPYVTAVSNDGGDAICGRTHIADRARRLLGLDSAAATDLFAPENTLNDLRRIVGDLCKETVNV